MSQAHAAVRWPGPAGVDAHWCRALGEALCEASWAEPKRLQRWLPSPVLLSLIATAAALFKKEETLVELRPPAGAKVTVVGDTHGQLHDFLRIFEVAGYPSADSCFVFNGDFVDRGAWGTELLALVLAWKCALPDAVVVLRGNHESEFCTQNYGFSRELDAKFPSASAKLDKQLLQLFAQLPLGARVGACFVCHGGLFRKPAGTKTKRARAGAACEAEESAVVPLSQLGSLEELRGAHRGGPDPDGMGVKQLASDVLWSDPAPALGLFANDARGIGLVFGPDVTQAFLAANRLRLIIRSHEGPDAREKRPDMGGMGDGWCVDHVVEAGRLCTLFSAPDYPQFYAEGEPRAHNQAALAVLSGPHFDDPALLRFDAAPRPGGAQPYYELDMPGSDEEGPAGETTVAAPSAASATVAASAEAGIPSAQAAEEGPAGEPIVAAPAAAATVAEVEANVPSAQAAEVQAAAAPPAAASQPAEMMQPEVAAAFTPPPPDLQASHGDPTVLVDAEADAVMVVCAADVEAAPAAVEEEEPTVAIAAEPLAAGAAIEEEPTVAIAAEPPAAVAIEQPPVAAEQLASTIPVVEELPHVGL